MAEPAKESTHKLTQEGSLHDISEIEPEVTFLPFPNKGKPDTKVPVWRVRFDLAGNSSVSFGLDVNDDTILGRGPKPDNLFDLTPYDAGDLGVSRQHATLRPTPSSLYVIDMDSTNGTLRNGQLLGPRTPYALANGDTLTLGNLQFVVRIIQRPSTGQTSALRQKADLADALVQVAKIITTQRNPDDVLDQVAEVAMSVTAAGETSVWLIDEITGELRLEASYGLEDEKVKQMRLPITGDTLAAKVIQTGKPVRASREGEESQIKVKTDYLVEAVILVPIALGGVTFGVLAATHRTAGHSFDERDQALLMGIADFAAIAIQNARLYRATDESLARRVDELASLNQLSQAMASSLDLPTVHSMLLERATQAWGAEHTVLWLYDSNRVLVPYKAGGEIIAVLNKAEKQVKRALDQTVKENKAVIVDIPQASDGTKPTGKTPAVGARSIAAVALRAQDNTIGALTLITRGRPLTETDLNRFQMFAAPVAMAIQNAGLFYETEVAMQTAEQARAVIDATANTLPQPMMILDPAGNLLISNQVAQGLLESDMAAILMGVSEGIGKTSELKIGERTFVTTAETTEGVGTIIVMQDITYVKQLEHVRAEFVKAMTHDLKGPLTSIKGWLYLVDKTAELNERAQDYLQKVSTASNRMLEMVNDLLEGVKLRDSMQLTPSVCSLEKIATNAATDLQGLAESKSMKLTVAVEGEPCGVNADESGLYHIALNLIENALKYAPENTRVDLRVKYRTDSILLQVMDQGPGVSPEELSHIFDEGFRGKEAAGSQSGHGLGLWVVQAMAKAHGGIIQARNRDEGGMEFTLTLPISLAVKS